MPAGRPLVVGRCDLDVAYARGLLPMPSGAPIGHEIIGEVIEVVQSRDQGLGVRVLVEGPGGLRTVTTSTSDLGDAAITRLVEQAVAPVDDEPVTPAAHRRDRQLQPFSDLRI